MKGFGGVVILLLLTVTIQAQKTGFEIKPKKDTTAVNVSFDAEIVKGANKSSIVGGYISGYSGRTFVKPVLKKNIQQRLSEDVPVTIIKDKSNGLPKYIEFKRNTLNYRTPGIYNVDSASSNFIKELKPYLSVSVKSNFKITESGVNRVKLKQTYKGIDFYGKEIILHFNQAGEGISFNGSYSTCDFEIDTNVNLSEASALQLVLNDLKTKTTVVELSAEEKEFFHYHSPELRKIFFEDRDLGITNCLAYEVVFTANVLETWKYFIDANNGKILRAYSILCSVDGPATTTATDLHSISRTVNTYLQGSLYKLRNTSKPMYNSITKEGVIETLNSQNTAGTPYVEFTSSNNTWTSPVSVSAHYNAGIAYDYFKNNHSRNSINGKGGSIYSFVNVAEEDGSAMDNAYWNGQAIFYGNGNTYFNPLAKGLDVAGHEMTHGVVQNEANLEYYDESGAINESMADIFGFMMDSTDWKIGEDVVKLSAYPSGALRNLQDPHNGRTSFGQTGYQPKHVSEQYHGMQDNKGVHINSGIPNHAFYLLATSASKTKASKIFYRALSEYLTKFSDFQDLRIACVQSAKDLHGASAVEVTKTEQAFDAVGIVGGSSTVIISTTLPVNPGQDYLLSVDTDPDNPATLYRSSVMGTNYYDLSEVDIISRPSVTDNGEYAVYVGSNNNIYSINLTNPLNPIETIIANDGRWSNVSISKDGARLAATTIYQDTSIYVYDIATQEWARFYLYNPTYSDSLKSEGPVYADALEWDYSGEFLIYDAFNVLNNISGTDIEYWDVNFINVWDNLKNDFGRGTIEKLFSNLPQDVSIGNPTFSKNSPYVIAFDYSDASNVAVLGFDIENNSELETIYDNNTLGWPSYSKNDDRVAFTSYSFSLSDYVVKAVDINTDKISQKSSAFQLIPNAQWPVYYAMGERNIVISGVQDKATEEINVYTYPNPFENSFSLTSKEYKMSEVLIYDSKGTVVYNQKLDSYNEIINTNDFTSGMYLVTVVLDGKYKSFKMIKR